MLLCVRQRTHVIHQVPNVIRRLEFAEGWHPCESDSVLDNPKQLLVRIALHSPIRRIQHPRHYDVADRTAFQSICTATAKERAALKSSTRIFCHRFDCCFVKL